jgi:hypothetical protein
MIPEALVCHTAFGRTRLRIASRKGDDVYFTTIAQTLSAYPGVATVRVNPVTGSVLLVHHAPLAVLTDRAAAAGLFRLQTGEVEMVPLSARIVQPFVDLECAVRRFSAGQLDLAGIALAALLGLGMYQLSRGNFTAPAWYTVFWYAVNVALRVHGDLDRAGA